MVVARYFPNIVLNPRCCDFSKAMAEVFGKCKVLNLAEYFLTFQANLYLSFLSLFASSYLLEGTLPWVFFFLRHPKNVNLDTVSSSRLYYWSSTRSRLLWHVFTSAHYTWDWPADFQMGFWLSSQITNPSMLSHIWHGKFSNGFILSNRSPLEDQLIQWPTSQS